MNRMNRMEGNGLIGIDRIRVLMGNFWREILRSRSRVLSGQLRLGIPFPDIRSLLFEIEIPCILLFLNRNKNS